MAGQVYVDGHRVDKAGTRISPKSHLEVKPLGIKYVSRGGFKLEGAVNDLNMNFGDRIVLDVGAATGGFTDCLLKHGARKVYALDVGYGLIDEKLRVDPRVVVLERINVRYASAEMFDESPEIAVVDTSFISLKLVLPVLKNLNIKELLALVKPQFEAGRAEAGRGKGVIRDPKVRNRVVKEIRAAAESLGYKVIGETPSAVKGPKGNVEVFLHLRM